MKIFRLFRRNGREQVNKDKNKRGNTIRNRRNDSSGKDLFPLGISSGAAIRALLVVLFLLDLFLVASFFRFRTGEFGAVLNMYLVNIFGGAVLLLLIYAAYAILMELFAKNGKSALRETAGTICLYLCAALVLGMGELTLKTARIYWLSPGFVGTYLTRSLFRYVGVTGAVITGFALLIAAVWFYGFVSGEDFREVLRLPGGLAKSLFRWAPGKSAKKTEKAEMTKAGTRVKEKTKGLVLVRRHKGEEIAHIEASPEEDLDITLPMDEGEREDYEFESTGFDIEGMEPGRFPPPLELFGECGDYSSDIDEEEIAENGRHVISTLAEFNVEAELAETIVGPTVIQYRLQLAPGIKVSRVAGLANDMAVALAVPSLRVEAPIPGKPYVGIEIPNPSRKPVNLRSILEHPSFVEGGNELPLGIGVAVDGRHVSVGLEKLPHLLVAGTTGSGKSVFISCCIASLCYSRRPDELKMLLIDPKRVEMKMYDRLPHTLMPPVVDAKKAVHALGWAIREMEKRYEMFAQARVRNLKGFNARALPKDRLPSIVIIIDELADLMFTSPKEVEDYICRLAQMARATGIHLIIATQRPSVNVVTGLIKANVPARVAFTLPSQTDSRTILDIAGAEKLLGSGDMLFLTPRLTKPMRLQGPMLEETAINRFIDYLVGTFGEPEHIDLDEQMESKGGQDSPFLDDPLVEEAVDIILQSGIASASRLQRQLRIGFTRAARLVDAIEQMGIVGAQDGARPREILVDEDEARQILEEHLRGGGA
ncbi:MAG TPA: DNA translocase FtsK [Synergistaceae bacterium]|jgi:S-DNA-T family DNA segregation ATPase FtsK/SpoIIIE|nr:MAG: DNA translocase FtsK [Synergistales bacterium 54_9]MDK2846090.1 segregation ATPase FtsK/SpoIIIE, family [Synergistales bacterium]MDN5335772.1 segregation ATPase FtsK/SpoIIIE, family [Synergistales bacterium]HAA47924.1 DNA translocase FtsK [Synergistaceae bacterium]HAG22974.1 DNA translocase FtsK [Synergistaceae bacterium]